MKARGYDNPGPGSYKNSGKGQDIMEDVKDPRCVFGRAPSGRVNTASKSKFTGVSPSNMDDTEISYIYTANWKKLEKNR